MENIETEPKCGLVTFTRTLAPCIGVFSLGMLKAIVGATLLQLQAQTNSSTEKISSVFLCLSSGLLLGNIVIALMLRFTRVRIEVVLSFGSVILSAVALFIPWCTRFLTLAFAFLIYGIGYGLCGGGGMLPYLIQTWQHKAGPYIQFTLFIHAAGATMTPYLVALFLPQISVNQSEYELTNNNQSYFRIQAGHQSNYTINDFDEMNVNPDEKLTATEYFYNRINDNGLISENKNSCNQDNMHTWKLNASMDSENTTILDTDGSLPIIFYPFFFPVTGLLLSVILYLSVVAMETNRTRPSNNTKNDDVTDPLSSDSKTKNSAKMSYVLFILGFVFCLLLSGTEASFGGWVIAFVTHYYTDPYSTIAWAATLFWFGETLGRLVAIFSSKCLQEKHQLIFLLALVNASNVTFLLAYHRHIFVSYICAFIYGFSLSPMLGLFLMFVRSVSAHLPEWVTSVLHMSMYVGQMVLPYTVGFLFANVSPLCFLYVLLANSLVQFALFIIMIIHSKKFQNLSEDNKIVVNKNRQLVKMVDLVASQSSLNL